MTIPDRAPRRSRLLLVLALIAVVVFLGGVGISAAGVIALEHYAPGSPSAPDATGAVLLIVGFGVAAVGLAALLFVGVLAVVRRARNRGMLLS